MNDEEIIRVFAAHPARRITHSEGTEICKRLKKIAELKCKRYRYIDLDDVMAEVLQKAVKGAAKFKDYGRPGAATGWLARITVNCANDHFKKQKRIRSHELPIGDLETNADETPPSLEVERQYLAGTDWTEADECYLEQMRMWTEGVGRFSGDDLDLHDHFYAALEAMGVDHPGDARVIEVQINLPIRAEACAHLGITGRTYANYLCRAKKLFAAYFLNEIGSGGSSQSNAAGGEK